MNQRQIDVILKEVLPNLGVDGKGDTVGIVTPYRNQADALKQALKGTGIKADTADKFQGQEREIIIFSTVDNQIGDFASDPNRLNVVVSRAVDRLIVVTDGNGNDHESPIHELIEYIQYHNYETVDSRISSVFDYLYAHLAEARAELLERFGRASDVESENLMALLIRKVLRRSEFSHNGFVLHVPLRHILRDMNSLDERERAFASNILTHVDFLIFSKVTRQPVLVVEVDGYAYHQANEKQLERDALKDVILKKYGIPIIRFSTIQSGEEERLIQALR